MRLLKSLVPRSMRAQFLVALLFIGVLPVSLAEFILLALNQSSVKQQVTRELGGLAKGVAGEISIFIGSRLEESTALASLADIVSTSEQAQEPSLESLAQKFTHFARLDIYDLAGRLASTSDQTTSVATIQISSIDVQTWQVINTTDARHFYLVIDSPIRGADHTTIGILQTTVDLADLAEIISKTHMGKSGRVFLLDENGNPLIDPDTSAMQSQDKYSWGSLRDRDHKEAGSFQYEWKGNVYVAAYASLLKPAWTVVAEQSEQEILENIYEYRLVGIGFIGLTSILASVVVFAVANTLAIPLQQLVTATKALGQGDLTVPVQVPSLPENELTRLVTSFMEMRDAVTSVLERERYERALSSAVLSSVPTGLMVLTRDFNLISINSHARSLFVGDQTGLDGFSLASIVAEDLRIATCNKPFAILFSSDPDSLTGKRLVDILPSASTGRLAQSFSTSSTLPSAILERDHPHQILRIFTSPILPANTDTDIRLLITIEDLTEMSQTKLRYRSMETLQKISLSILRSDDLSTTLSSILSEAMQARPFSTGAVWLISDGDNKIELFASKGYQNPEHISHAFSSNEFQSHDQLRIVTNGKDCPGFEILTRENLVSMYIVPVKTQEKILGFIELGSRSNSPVDQAENDLLQAIGNQMGIAVQKARLDAALLRSEAEARLLSLIASRTINAAVITDAKGCIEWTNAGFSRITGYSLEEVIGRKQGDFLQGPETDLETVELMREAINKGEGYIVEVINYHKSGQKFWLHIEVQPIRDDAGHIVKFMALESDITERKAYEQALALARDQALEASRLKSEFLAMMSHEIRTPMNGILGMSELLSMTTLTDEQREFMDIVRSEGESLLIIINDILDFSKIEAGRIQLDPVAFDLRELVQSVADSIQIRVSMKSLELGIEVRDETPNRLIGDSSRIKQVLVNFASNAIKFTKQGRVDIRIGMIQDNGGLVNIRFEIQDTGIGISHDAQIRLFQPFVQADGSITRKYGGTGLGLAISKRLVELMGGQIGLQSELGEGSLFWFVLPLLRVESAERH